MKNISFTGYRIERVRKHWFTSAYFGQGQFERHGLVRFMRRWIRSWLGGTLFVVLAALASASFMHSAHGDVDCTQSEYCDNSDDFLSPFFFDPNISEDTIIRFIDTVLCPPGMRMFTIGFPGVNEEDVCLFAPILSEFPATPPRPGSESRSMPGFRETGTGELNGLANPDDPNSHGLCGGYFGNPVNAATGNKVQREVDYQDAGRLPLQLSRTFNSAVGALNSPLGKKWTIGVPQLVVWEQGSASGTVEIGLLNIREDGQRIRLRRHVKPDSGYHYYTRENGRPIRVLRMESSGWLVVNGTMEEEYDAKGRIVFKVDHESGEYLTYEYPNTTFRNPSRISHSSGRSLQLSYSGGKLRSIRDPAGQTISYAYNARGDLASVTYPSATGQTERRQYFYDDSRFPDNLTRIRDEDLRETRWAYDSSGRAVSSENGQGVNRHAMISHALVNGGWESRVRNPLGRDTTYRYEIRGASGSRKLVSVSGNQVGNCLAANRSLTYDANGYYDRLTDWEGNIVDYDFDRFGQLTKIVTAADTVDARETRYEFDSSLRKPLLVENDKSRTVYEYDPAGTGRTRYVRRTNLSASGTTSEERVTSFSYPNLHTTPRNTALVTQLVIDGPRTDTADVTTISYSQSGLLLSFRNAKNQVTSFSHHDAHGRPKKIWHPTGMRTDLVYNPRGWVTSKKDIVATKTLNGATVTQNRQTTYEYQRNGLVSKVTFPDATYFEFFYNIYNQVFRVDNGLGEMLWFDYDLAGNVTKQRIRHLQTTTTWQDFSRPGEPEFLPVTTTELVTDRETEFDYDALNRLEKITNGKGQSSIYRYNKNDLLKLFKDAKNNQSTQSYNARNELTQKNQPDGGIVRMSYDENGLLSQVTDPINVSTDYSVDGFGSVTRDTSPDSGNWTYTYDKAGNTKTVTDGRGYRTTYSYDALNRVTSISHPSGPATIFQYDTNQKGYLYRVTDDSGSTTFERNQAGQVTKKTAVIDGIMMVTNYQYDVGGRVEQSQLPGGTRLYYSFDSAGQTTRVEASHPSFSRRNVAYGIKYLPFGPLSRLTFGDNRARILDYDSDYELEQIVSGNAMRRSYNHDDNGNIIEIVDGIYNQTRTFRYDVMDRLDHHNGPDGSYYYLYDDNGNRRRNNSYYYDNHSYQPGTNRLTTKPGQDYSYNANGNVTRVDGGYPSYDNRNRVAAFWDNSWTTTHYDYNAFGERTRKTRGSFDQRFVYGDSAQLLHERGSQGTIDYIYLNGQPIAMVRNGSLYFVHTDHLGRPERVTSGATTIWQANNTAFGGDTAWGYFELNLRFPGQYFDSESGLYYNYFRYYDPATGRYILSDPIGLSGGLNRYSYANNKPTMYVDPFGLDPYLVGRPLEGFEFAGHMFIVTGANYIGDPNATVYSYGRSNASKKHGRNTIYGLTGRVDETTEGLSAGTEASDRRFWNNMKGAVDCKIHHPYAVPIAASDTVVEGWANNLVPTIKYFLPTPFLGRLDAVNSNSAAQAVANRASGFDVNQPAAPFFGYPGADEWQRLIFDE